MLRDKGPWAVAVGLLVSCRLLLIRVEVAAHGPAAGAPLQVDMLALQFTILKRGLEILVWNSVQLLAGTHSGLR